MKNPCHSMSRSTFAFLKFFIFISKNIGLNKLKNTFFDTLDKGLQRLLRLIHDNQYILLHTVFSISNYTSYFLGLIKHRLFYIELHTVNSLLNTAKQFYILLSTVFSIFYYTSQYLQIIKLSCLHILLSNVIFASIFG